MINKPIANESMPNNVSRTSEQHNHYVLLFFR